MSALICDVCDKELTDDEIPHQVHFDGCMEKYPELGCMCPPSLVTHAACCRECEAVTS